jgi:hypothetical protein
MKIGKFDIKKMIAVDGKGTSPGVAERNRT